MYRVIGSSNTYTCRLYTFEDLKWDKIPYIIILYYIMKHKSDDYKISAVNSWTTTL